MVVYMLNVSRAKVWQKRLSSLRVAQFPWDPQLTQAPSVSAPTVPSNGYAARAQQSSSLPTAAQSTPSAPSSSNTANGVRIKTEPGQEANPSISSLPASQLVNPTLSNSSAAAQRAATLIQQKFGSQANSSIGAMQSGGLKVGVQPPGGQDQPDQNGQQYQQQQRNAVNAAQTDGPGEWKEIVARGQVSDEARVQADDVIRRHVEEMALQMEGGGLLRPLSEHRAGPRRNKRKTAFKEKGKQRDNGTAMLSTTMNLRVLPIRTIPSSSFSSTGQTIGGYDGIDDDDDDEAEAESKSKIIKHEGDVEIDEDAINSDLDDPDDNLDEHPDDDDAMSQIMLCVYDKVQRTKNKWKCTLKDGVLTVDGRE